jgi:hypothetical protein
MRVSRGDRWKASKIRDAERAGVLVLVSMVDGDLFDKLSKIGTILRKNQQPFGGMQVSRSPYRRGSRSRVKHPAYLQNLRWNP